MTCPDETATTAEDVGLPTVHQVWRLALPTGTALRNAHQRGLDQRVHWARRTASYAPAFAGLEAGEMALVAVDSLRLVDERLTLDQAIRALAEHGIVAVAVVGSVQANAIEAADRVGISLLAMPPDTDLRDVEKDIIRLIVEREAQLDRRGRQVYRHLAQLSIEGRGLIAIAQGVRDILSKPVVVQDERLDVLAAALTDDCGCTAEQLALWLADDALLRAWLQDRTLDAKSPPGTVLAMGQGEWARSVAAIVIEGQLGGYISVLDPYGRLDDLDALTAERAALVCASEVAKRRAVEAAEQRLRGDFLDLVLTVGAAETGALARRGAEIGYDLEGFHAVALLGLETELGLQPETFARNDLTARLAALDVQVLWCPYEGDLAALCRDETAETLRDLDRPLRETRQYVQSMFPTAQLSAGVGRPGEGLAGLRRSFAQARESLSLARSLFGGERVLSFGDLGLYDLLGRLGGCDELDDFYSQTLASLVAYDDEHDTALVATLEAFFQHHGNVSQTAESLFLHRNSLLYRLDRIVEITGLSLDDADDRFSLQLALKLRPFLRNACDPT